MNKTLLSFGLAFGLLFASLPTLAEAPQKSEQLVDSKKSQDDNKVSDPKKKNDIAKNGGEGDPKRDEGNEQGKLNSPPVGKDKTTCSDSSCCTTSSSTLAYAVMAVLLVFYLLVMKLIALALQNGTWKLGDALSEEFRPDPNHPVPADAPAMVASSSRLVAFIGSIALVGLFIVSTFYAIWALFACQPLGRLSEMGQYLLYGSALFAPYAFNKLSEVFKLK